MAKKNVRFGCVEFGFVGGISVSDIHQKMAKKNMLFGYFGFGLEDGGGGRMTRR
jgi:hypothetical protein